MAQQYEWPECNYLLRQDSFMPAVPGGTTQLLKRDTVVTYAGKPGPHMEPTCEQGREAVRIAGEQSLDPMRRLSLSNVSEDTLLERLREAEALTDFLKGRLQREQPQVRLPGSPHAAAAPPVAAPTPPAPPPAAAPQGTVPPPPPPPPPGGKKG